MRGGADGIVAPNDYQLALADVRIRLAPAFAERRFDATFGGRAADAALQLAGAEPVPEAGAGNCHLDQTERAAVTVRQDGFGAVLGDDFSPTGGDFVNGFSPADPLPLATPFRPQAAKRMEQPTRVIDMLEVGPDLGAEPAFRDRVFRIAVELDGTAIPDFGDDPAGVGPIMPA